MTGRRPGPCYGRRSRSSLARLRWRWSLRDRRRVGDRRRRRDGWRRRDRWRRGHHRPGGRYQRGRRVCACGHGRLLAFVV